MFHLKLIRLFPLVIILAAGCTTSSTSDVVNLGQDPGGDYVPLKEEVWANEQADLFHEEFVKKGLLYNDPDMLGYLADLKERLLKDKPYSDQINIYIIRSATPNAFAMPNGNIYIHSGLLTPLTQEDQLAAILAHEVIHVAHRHGVKGIIDRKNTLVGAHVADFLTGGLGLVYFGAIATIMDYSRDQERAADTEGYALYVSAGYSPDAMLTAFESMQGHPELKHVTQSIYSSHPDYEERIATLREMVSGGVDTGGEEGYSDASVNTADVDSNRFLTMKAELVELNINMRLRHRQFKLAQSIIDQVSVTWPESSQLDFYRGEVAFGMAKYPRDAAKEDHWIATGKTTGFDELEEQYKRDVENNLQVAAQNYQASLNHANVFAPSYKRMGEVFERQGDSEKAKQAYTQYLEIAPDAMDRQYVEYRLMKINKI